ncbi:MAG: hypothetical protein ABI837_04075 [Acidobacteriota bacterium]
MRKLVMLLTLFVVTLPVFGQGLALRNWKSEKPEELTYIHRTASELLGEIARVGKQTGRLRSNVVLEGSEFAFAFPIVGSTAAGGGLFFRSETIILNRRNTAQNVALTYLPIGGANNCNLNVKILRLEAGKFYYWLDFVSEVFNTSGLAAVVVSGVDANGNVDANAAIDGNSRIWSPQPGTSGTTSQNFPSISVQMPAGAQSSFGLRQDPGFRTNYGIFNIGQVRRTFDILVNGLQGSTTFSRDVDGCSAVLTALPGGTFGAMELIIGPRDGQGGYISYGSSVDNVTGDSWSIVGRSF